MKKILLLIFLLSQVLTAQFSFAYYEESNSATFTTVQDILDGDTYDLYVKVRGFLVKKISHDIYLFDDDTARIKVKVTERMMQDLDIDARTRVVITGYVRRLEHQTNIEGETIYLAN